MAQYIQSIYHVNDLKRDEKEMIMADIYISLYFLEFSEGRFECLKGYSSTVP